VRKIKIQPPDTPEWQNWDRKCKNATNLNWERVSRNEELVFNRKTYKEYKEFFIDSAFHGKCGYCEGPVTGFQHGDVEHFRPTKKVANEKNEAIHDHPGYHWLFYNWQNLLISCQTCNQIKDGIGKGNRFPVLGIHADRPETLDQEKPLLINPTSDLPEDCPSKHLAITPDGYLQGLTDRGKMCIQIFGLNLRDHLVEGRHRAYIQALFLKGQLHSESKEDRQIAINKITAIKHGKKSYSIAQVEAVKALKELYLQNKNDPI
jgi:5-methylcytosine-specific restriction endonuclease McrA